MTFDETNCVFLHLLQVQHQGHNSLELGCRVSQLHIPAPKFCMYQWDWYAGGQYSI